MTRSKRFTSSSLIHSVIGPGVLNPRILSHSICACLVSTVLLFCVDVTACFAQAFSAEECSSLERLQSAERLIEDGRAWQNSALELCERIDSLKNARRTEIAGDAAADSMGLWRSYQELFKEYEQSLAEYRQHRHDYFEHAQRFHNRSSAPEAINGSPSQMSSLSQMGTGEVSSTNFRPLKLQAQDKCAELQELEQNIVVNEQRLEELLQDLSEAQQKESSGTFASLWNEANDLAMKNNELAGKFNHIGIQKTMQSSKNVHNLILEANRDGAYSAHLNAYRDLSQSNNLQQEIFKRANQHGRFAVMALSKLSVMRPSLQGVPPEPDSKVYSAEDLEQQSADLDQEYANVQSLFEKLETIRKSLPPQLQKTSIR